VVKLARPPEVTLRLVGRGEGGSLLAEAYRRYCPYVAAVILRLGGGTAELDDLVQDVFVEAARGIKGLTQPEALKGWLATIAVRVVRRRLRFRRLRRFLSLGLGGSAALATAPAVDPAASPFDKLLLRAVYQVLEEIAVDDRLAFALHHIEGEKVDVVARLCRCSLATAKRRIARARAIIEARVGDG
jgi:RNA polymerase sigma-70 factor (ECF subfamily)